MVISYPSIIGAWISSLIARFVGPTWTADRTQVGPMLAPWTLLSGILYGGDMSPCTGSRVNANYEQIASWDRCQFGTRGPQMSDTFCLTLPWPIWLCHDQSDSAMTHLTLPWPIWLCHDPSDSAMTHLTLPWPIPLCHDPSDSAMTHLTAMTHCSKTQKRIGTSWVVVSHTGYNNQSILCVTNSPLGCLWH